MRHRSTRLGPGELLLIREELFRNVVNDLGAIREAAVMHQFATAESLLATALETIEELKKIDQGDVFHLLPDLIALEDKCHDMYLLLHGTPHDNHRWPRSTRPVAPN